LNVVILSYALIVLNFYYLDILFDFRILCIIVLVIGIHPKCWSIKLWYLETIDLPLLKLFTIVKFDILCHVYLYVVELLHIICLLQVLGPDHPDVTVYREVFVSYLDVRVSHLGGDLT